MRILIADDDAITRRLLETILSKWGYEVQIASDGDEAWAALQGEGAPKLAILDWMMPGLDGVEICRRARQRMDAPYVYMMLLTSKIRKEDIIEGMDAGADDYLTKPFNRHELEVRLRAGLRILDLQEALSASGDELALGRARENETAVRIRQTLLLADPPAVQPGLEIAAATVPGTEQEGDFYDFFPHAARGGTEETLDVVIGEALGRGLPAALIAAATKNHFLRVLHRASQGEGGIPPPAEVVTQVHDAVAGQFLGQKSFETLCYARFDVGASRLDYVDCGHTPTAHYSAAFKTCRMLRGDNMPLGFGQHEHYRQLGLPFGVGDVFVFYSEGVTIFRGGHDREKRGRRRLRLRPPERPDRGKCRRHARRPHRPPVRRRGSLRPRPPPRPADLHCAEGGGIVPPVTGGEAILSERGGFPLNRRHHLP